MQVPSACFGNCITILESIAGVQKYHIKESVVSTCQVRVAFLAGLAVVLALIPVNRWLARRIETASADMMGCKDARVRRTGELLRGIRQIKAAAWEPAFISRVTNL